MVRNQELMFGQVCRGSVVYVSSEEVLVELDQSSRLGVVLPINLTWEPDGRIEDLVQVGQEIVAVVRDSQSRSDRVYISVKHMQNDPFLEFARNSLGVVLEGEVCKVLNFGYFVQVNKYAIGFVPCADVEADLGGGETTSMLGRKVAVRVDSINIDTRHIMMTRMSIG